MTDYKNVSLDTEKAWGGEKKVSKVPYQQNFLFHFFSAHTSEHNPKDKLDSTCCVQLSRLCKESPPLVVASLLQCSIVQFMRSSWSRLLKTMGLEKQILLINLNEITH